MTRAEALEAERDDISRWLAEARRDRDDLRRKLDEAEAGWTRVCADHGADHAARQRLERDLASALGVLREIETCGTWVQAHDIAQRARAALTPAPPGVVPGPTGATTGSCRMCRGSGADEYGAECSDCDGEGRK